MNSANGIEHNIILRLFRILVNPRSTTRAQHLSLVTSDNNDVLMVNGFYLLSYLYEKAKYNPKKIHEI